MITIRGWYNRPVVARSTKWTQSHPTQKKITRDGYCFERQNWVEYEYLLSKENKQTPWLQPASELYRASDRHLLAKLVPTLAERGCRVVSATNPHGR
jgi:hypothetical protein